MMRSRGLFSEVGVSQLFESEKLLCCFLSWNFLRLLATMPSQGDCRFISAESIGRFEGSRGRDDLNGRNIEKLFILKSSLFV